MGLLQSRRLHFHWSHTSRLTATATLALALVATEPLCHLPCYLETSESWVCFSLSEALLQDLGKPNYPQPPLAYT